MGCGSSANSRCKFIYVYICLILNMNSDNELRNEIVAQAGKGDDDGDTGIPDHGLGDNAVGGNDYEDHRAHGNY